MKTAIIVHGMPSQEEYFDIDFPSPSNSHWLPWLQKQLLCNNVITQTPELPKPYNPVYEDWLHVFEQMKIDEETILIGHSCGAGFLVRWLSENIVKVGKVVLVAPWLDPTCSLTTGFFTFSLGKDIVSKTNSISLFVSEDDDKEILDSVEKLEKEVSGLMIQKFSKYGHFTFSDMKTKERWADATAD
jgi:predicted alpha/beta hydrolase family esterase